MRDRKEYTKSFWSQNKGFLIAILTLVFIANVNMANAADYRVTTLTDDGDGVCDSVCTLREAISKANVTTADDVIIFDVTGTIVLTASESYYFNITIPDAATSGQLRIIGPGADILSIDDVVGGNHIFTLSLGAVVEISGLTITGADCLDSTAPGGGILNRGTLTLNKVIVRENRAIIGGGGIGNYGVLTVNDSMISDNNSVGSGGGVSNLGGEATLNNSTVSNNQSEIAGGIRSANFGSDRSVLTLNNSTVSGNTARTAFSETGGGINTGEDSLLFLNNSTLSNNSARIESGNGLYNRGITVIRNSIIANSLNKYDCFNAGGKIDAYNSLIEDGLGCVSGANINNLTGDPLLGALADNGGFTLTHALLPDSIAIDSGNNSLIPSGVTTDQRGETRIINSTVDMGSFEAAFNSDDDDSDGVLDSVDVCPNTNLPEDNPTQGLKKFRYIADADGNFVDKNGRISGITITHTRGCSGIQIVDTLGLPNHHRKFGITWWGLLYWVWYINLSQ